MRRNILYAGIQLLKVKSVLCKKKTLRTQSVKLKQLKNRPNNTVGPTKTLLVHQKLCGDSLCLFQHFFIFILLVCPTSTFSTTSFFCSFCWRASKRFRLLQRPQLSEVGRDSVKTKQRNHKDPVFGECL